MAMGPMRPGGAISDINVTPLVDVMLVLLVIFMIAAPLIEKQKVSKQKVSIDLPRTDAQDVDLQQEKKLLLSIDREFKILLDDVVLTDCGPERALPYPVATGGCLSELEAKLGSNVKLQQDREIYLLADRQVPYGLVVSTMARLKKAGVDKLGMVTDPPGGSPDQAPGAPAGEGSPAAAPGLAPAPAGPAAPAGGGLPQ